QGQHAHAPGDRGRLGPAVRRRDDVRLEDRGGGKGRARRVVCGREEGGPVVVDDALPGPGRDLPGRPLDSPAGRRVDGGQGQTHTRLPKLPDQPAPRVEGAVAPGVLPERAAYPATKPPALCGQAFSEGSGRRDFDFTERVG